MTAVPIAGVPVAGHSRGKRLRGWLGAAAGGVAAAAGWVSGVALGSVRWLPGVACGVGASFGLAMVVHSVFRQVPELGVGLLVASVFCGLIDKRIA